MQRHVDLVRAFNRGWTEVLALLDKGLLGTEHSLAEARVLFELAHAPAWERQTLRDRLGMDASFLTRVLGRLEVKGLVVTSTSERDGRALNVELTEAGRDAFAVLDERSTHQITDLLHPLTDEQRAIVAESMTTLAHLFGLDGFDEPPMLRGLQSGDLGWVVSRHGAIYRDEFGWDLDFEALVAHIVAEYHEGLKPEREHAWIAEVGGARAGCVFCCERDISTAQLRILLVEPWARGLGLGSLLVDTCIEFARSVGYSKMVLWTNDVLVAARRIYESAGFELVDQEPHHSFGHNLVGQTWELDLDAT